METTTVVPQAGRQGTTPREGPTRRAVLAGALGALGVIGGTLAGACSGGGAAGTAELPKPATGPVTLEFLNFWGPVRDPLLEKVWAEFKKTHPTITVQNTHGTYMIMPAGARTNTFIAVAGGLDMPMGTVAHIMARQAKKLGEQLMSVPARTREAS